MAWRKIEVLQKYIEQGWPIFPLHWLVNGHCSCGKPKCTSPGKHPRVRGGFQAASTNLNLVADWDHKWPDANWGMRTGSREDGGSNILVVDLDTKNQGPQTWEMLVMDHPDREDTVTVRSGGGGTHLWYRYPEGAKIGCSAGVLGPGVDIRADGGYIIVPPSRTQKTYAFDMKPSETPISDPPAWLLEELKQSTHKLVQKMGEAERIPLGSRHDAVKSRAVELRRIGLGYTEVLSNLKNFRETWFEAGDHPVTDSELKAMAEWVCKLTIHFAETDLGNTERYVDQHKDTARYCPQVKQWFVWDGRIWKRNATEAAFDKAYLTVRSIQAEARNICDGAAREKRIFHAIRSENGRRMDTIVRHARNRLEVKANEFDHHRDLLTVRNGVVDLRSGELSPHDPVWMMTHLVDLDYDPQAACPKWLAFLEIISAGDQKLVDYLQLFAGYCLTGRVDEQLIFFIYGKGANGKTTFMETIKNVMGTYFVKLPVGSVLNAVRPGKGPTPYIAQLAGARLAQTSEVPEDRVLDEALIKDLSGCDSLTARGMYSEPVIFDATHKLVIVGNYQPNIQGVDEAIWRRIRVIPFTERIPEDKRQRFSMVMAAFGAESQGILTWLISGSMRWYREGLATPYKVAEATAEYRKEQDVVSSFVEDVCRRGKALRVLKADLYRGWRRWAEENGEREYVNKSKSWFTRRIKEMGFVDGGNGNHYIMGLELKR